MLLETKSKKGMRGNMKKRTETIILIIAMILSIGTSLMFLTPIYMFVLTTLYEPNFHHIAMILTSLILFGFLVYIVDKYLLKIISLIQKKKTIKAIWLIAVIIIVIIVGIFLRLEANTFLVNVLMPFIYIVGTISIPIMIIGMMMLSSDVNKKMKMIWTIIFIVITIGIYSIQYTYLISATEEVIKNTQSFWKAKTEKVSNSSEYNLIYLENYKQKMEREGYLDKYDVENILKIVDSRTDHILVHYRNAEENFDYNNVDNQLMDELGKILEGNYYQFHYTHKNGQTDIYFEKYQNEESKTEEKNADIFVGVEPNYEVTNTKAEYENEYDESFLFENRVNLSKGTDTTIDHLKILFAFDEQRHNYIPSVENEQLKNIESYQIYSSGMKITLKEGISLNKKDYTLRINRYNEYLVVDGKQQPFYAYKFEPVVTETRNGQGNTIIEIDFDNTYALGELKNIEIIF